MQEKSTKAREIVGMLWELVLVEMTIIGIKNKVWTSTKHTCSPQFWLHE